MRQFIITVILVMLGGIAPAFGLEVFSGSSEQGGMIVIKAKKGHSLSLDGAPLMVTEDGFAVVGFHRDDSDAITITAKMGGAVTDRLTLTPNQRVYKEQRINGLPSKMVTPPDDVLARIKRDGEVVKAARDHATEDSAFSKPFIWPAQGIITGVYGSRRILNDEPRAPHYGIDIAAPKGTPVKAPQAGTIRMIEDLYFTGWTIILDHGHGVSSTFLHLDDASVKLGDYVEQGAVIGTVGSTGRSTGPHLDWRINLFQKRLDPALLVGDMPK